MQGADLGLSAFAGFDVQVAPRVVVGGFVDYDWSRQRTTASASSPFLFGQSLSAALPSLDQGWTIGGRAGFLVTPDILLYGLAGYSEMRINNWNLNYVIFGGPSFTVQEPALTSHGYTVGAGAEYRLASNVSLRGEYR